MRSVAENTAAGENIGATVMARDTDAGDTLMYTLGGTDMALFDIDPDTGQIIMGADDSLDFEMPADADTGTTPTRLPSQPVTATPPPPPWSR